jgi:integrase
MSAVEAIKSKRKIALVHTLLKKHGNRDYADIFKLGINVAFRITDLLSVEYKQIKLERNELTVIEGKTGKKRTVALNTAALAVIVQRRKDYPNDKYLFQSHSRRGKTAKKPIDRSSVWRKFQEVGMMADVDLGTHSMRKTRGYMMHANGFAIEEICRVLNHSTPAVTMEYIGLNKEQTLKTYHDLVL